MKLRSLLSGALMLAAAGSLFFAPGPLRASTVTTLHVFDKTGGSQPDDSLILGADGAFYGTTLRGGANDNGVVFRLAFDGTYTVLHEFGAYGDGLVNADGARPYSGLVDGRDGFFYGTTASGGTAGRGTVYRVSATGVFTALLSFDPVTTGAQARAALTLGSDGIFYGATYSGGGGGHDGTVFSMTPAGALTVLGFFDAATGYGASGTLVESPAGVFYGTVPVGGAGNKGAVFKFAADGSTGVVPVHTFSATGSGSVNADGAQPFGGLTLAADGTLYGTTSSGGTSGLGTIFSVSPTGEFRSLFSFGATGTGTLPYAGLTLASDGNLYGVTTTGTGDGNIFQFSPDSGYRVVASLDFAATGATSYAGLVEGPDRALYGLASVGGADSAGTAYRIALPGPTVMLTATVPKVTSGSGDAAQFVVSIPRALDHALVVHYTIKGSALGGTDYYPLSGKAKIKPGKTGRSIPVVTTHDHGSVPKVVKIRLTADDAYTLGTALPVKVKLVP